jgi:flagellar hook-associated protein 3 FlgL
MRITSNTFSNSLLNQLSSLGVRQTRLQTQAATGQRIQNAEDDPVAMRRVLDLQAESGTVSQYQRNIARQQELAQASYTSIKSLKTISDRAGEIATLADGLKSQQELNAYATEVTEMIKQAAQLMNTTNRGDYIFGGTVADQPPYAVATDANGQVTSVTYQGNTTVSEVEISEGVQISAQSIGENNSGSGLSGLITDSRTGADFFNHLIQLRDNLMSGNTAVIAGTVQPNLAKDENNILGQISANGVIQSRLEATASALSDRSLSLQESVSTEMDADLSQTLVKLSQTQTAYQAALQSGAKVLSMSLMDYLR